MHRHFLSGAINDRYQENLEESLRVFLAKAVQRAMIFLHLFFREAREGRNGQGREVHVLHCLISLLEKYLRVDPQRNESRTG
jgi:hypothetical protein